MFFTISFFNFSWTHSNISHESLSPSFRGPSISTMYSSRPCLFVFSLLFPSGSCVHAECYYPDKSIVPNFQACNLAQANGTACCELSTSVCTTEGYCVGNAGFFYRGGCTDPDWASPNCAKNCLDSTWPLLKSIPAGLNPNINCFLVAQRSFSDILPCSSGVYTEYFCCSDVAVAVGDSKSCCHKSFKFNRGNPNAPSPNFHDDTSTSTLSGSSSTSTLLSSRIYSSGSSSTSTLLSAQIYSSGSSSTSTLLSTPMYSSVSVPTNKTVSGASAPPPIPSARTTFKSSTTIGVGIGVPLGLLLLLGMGFLLYLERQRRTLIGSLKHENQTALSRMQQRQPHDEYPMVSINPGLLANWIRSRLRSAKLQLNPKWNYWFPHIWVLSLGGVHSGPHIPCCFRGTPRSWIQAQAEQGIAPEQWKSWPSGFSQAIVIIIVTTSSPSSTSFCRSLSAITRKAVRRICQKKAAFENGMHEAIVKLRRQRRATCLESGSQISSMSFLVSLMVSKDSLKSSARYYFRAMTGRSSQEPPMTPVAAFNKAIVKVSRTTGWEASLLMTSISSRILWTDYYCNC